MSKRVAILKGSSILLLSLAYGCANTLPGGTGSPVSGAQLSGSSLISNNAGGLISNNAGGLISNNAGGLISNNAGGLISNNAGGYRTLATAADNFVLVPGAKVAVFNERNEMVSYGWSTVDKDGNYSFKRLKDSTHLLFLKAVYQVGDKQVTLMAVCKAPREAKTITANVDPATTLVAKKVLEMLRLRVVSVSTVKAESFTTMATQLAPVMTDAAAVLAVLQPPAAAAKTFDQAIGEVNVELPALKTQIAASVASAPNVIAQTPVDTGVQSENSPTTPTTGTGSEPAPTPGPTQAPGNSNAPAPTGAVTTIEGLTGSEFALSKSTNIDADRNGGTLLIANGDKVTSLAVQSTTQVGGSNEAASGVLAVAASGTSRYYLTATQIVKPSGAVTLSGVNNPSDFVVNGNFAYVTSQVSHVIYKVDLSTGTGVVFAGSENSPGRINGNASTTRFNGPRGITFAGTSLFVADSNNRVIRKVALDGTSSAFAGSGQPDNNDGDAAVASFRSPVDLTADAAGNLYIVDAGSGVIRKATSAGVVTTIAGNGTSQSIDGTGAAASFRFPTSIALGTLDGHPILFVGEDDTEKKIRVVQNW